MADRGPDRGSVRNVGPGSVRPSQGGEAGSPDHSQPVDAGRTSGGGSLGHDLPPDAEAQTNTRNAGDAADAAEHRAREHQGEHQSDPVMPDKGSTLRTKI